jgi:transcriptional regulator with XRE-family HTH domain
LRTKRGWSQVYLAELSGIGRVHISELENGRREAGLRTLEALAGSFEITIAQLMRGI